MKMKIGIKKVYVFQHIHFQNPKNSCNFEVAGRFAEAPVKGYAGGLAVSAGCFAP